MTKQLNTDQLDRLAEIKEEILVLLDEALDLVRGTPEEQRANHWFATFCTALDKDNTQGNDSTITMQETIDAAQIHKRTVIGEIFDDSLHDCSFMQVLERVLTS